MGVKRTQAKTLVQTEAAAITMKAQQGCFQELDIEEYEIEETLDSFTCSFCGEMDGKHFTMSEMEHPIKIQRIHVDMKRRLAVPGMERLSPLYPDRQSISIRFMLLSVHYRSQLNYTLDVIESCKAALQRLYTCRDTLNRAIEAAPEGEASAQALADVKEAQEQFIRVMDDDFNTADGISTIFELVRKINTAVSAGNATKGTLKAYNDEFTALTNVLGLLYNNNDEEQIPAEITELIEKRKEARKAKDFALADSIRDQIKELGWVVEETRQGTIVKKA